MRNRSLASPHEVSVEQARVFLRTCGFSEESLSTMNGEEIVALAQYQYQRVQRALHGSIPLLVTQRWMLYLTPLRWGWKDIDMYGWRLLHKGPFYLMHATPDDA